MSYQFTGCFQNFCLKNNTIIRIWVYLCLLWRSYLYIYLYLSIYNKFLVIVQSLNHVLLFATSWTAARQAPLSFTFFWSLQYCSLQHWTLLSPPDTSTAEHRFCFGPAAFLSGSISNCPSLFPSSILDTFQPGGAYLPTWCHIFLPFHTAYGALEARILEWFSIPSSSGNGIVKIPSIQYCPKIFLEKKKEMRAKRKILSYCSPQSLHPPFPRV